MNMTQIESKLQGIFNESLSAGSQREIVFWLDREREFIDEIEQLTIDGVKIHILTNKNQFFTKYLLEEIDLNSSYLIYTNIDFEDNWLTDTILYSKIFFADRLSLLMSELNIDSALRSIVKKYERFFNNKERLKKFKSYGIENFSEEIIERAIMSVLCNDKTLIFETVLKIVLMDTLEDKKNKYLSLIEKFFDADVFWSYVKNQYDYKREEKTLKTLFIHLTVTAFNHSVSEDYLSSVKEYIAEHNKANSLVFIDHWMHHKTDYITFDQYAKMVEDEIEFPSLMQHIPLSESKQADIFPSVDKAIIMHIANSLFEKHEDFEEYTKLIMLRRSKHYYDKYKAVYDALFYTIKMHEFQKKYQYGIPYGQAIDMYVAYHNEYYIMDTYYRKFYLAFDELITNELLLKLKKKVEYLYTIWFIGELSSLWSLAVRDEMTKKWNINSVPKQQDFYSSTIAKHVRKNERVFVIISDAMRYEVGFELAERLNSETMGVCEIQTMLGVVPSVTKLGMASLLPHRNIDFDNEGHVFIDGKDSKGLENRKKIIESFVEESTAMNFQDIMIMNKAGRRDALNGKKVVYIYHDAIDAIGDKASTEVYTFDAVEKTLEQLYNLVKIISGDLSSTNIYITADHGFLYQRSPLEESDKIVNVLNDKVEVKRRYALSKEKRDIPGQLAIDLSSVVKNDLDLLVYTPNGTIRNQIKGPGVNFVHGGTSLQEIVVPLLSFKNNRSGQKRSQMIKKIDIKLTSTIRKITNSIFTLEFFQTEKVEDKKIPRTVAIFMTDTEGNVLSNEETIIGDRSFDNPSNRIFKLQFVLKNMSYDRNKSYYLIVKDTETNIVTDKIQFSINLGIVSDFEF